MFVESAREKCFLAFTATSCLISFLNGLHSTCTASWSFVRCPFRFTSTSLCLLVWYFNHFLMKSQYMETLKSLFTAFYPCFVIIFLEKITSFMLGTWYCTWCFLRFFLGKNVFLTGKIFRPLFDEITIHGNIKITFFMKSTWYRTWCLMNFFSSLHLSINVSCILCIQLLFVKFL